MATEPVTTARQIVSMYCGLILSDRRKIATKLGLRDDADNGLSEYERIRAEMRRANERGILGDVLAQIRSINPMDS